MPRKQKQYHYIYKTTNNITGRYYYGMHSTDDLNDGYLGSGKRLRYSINKYGKDSHTKEILEYCDSRDDLKSREAEIVNLNEIAKEDCMNIQPGGGGGIISDEHHIKMRKGASKWISEKLKDPTFFSKNRKVCSNRFKKMHENGEIKYNTFTGRNHSDETKKKMSESSKGTQIGSKNSQFGTCWIYNDIESKKIKREDLDSHLKSGWIKGRKIKF